MQKHMESAICIDDQKTCILKHVKSPIECDLTFHNMYLHLESTFFLQGQKVQVLDLQGHVFYDNAQICSFQGMKSIL